MSIQQMAEAAKAAGVGAGVLLTAILVRGGLGYVAGRAMAPSAAKKNSYGAPSNPIFSL